MINASTELRRLVSEGAPPLVRAQLVLASGNRMELDGGDFMDVGTSFSQSTSADGAFDIGAAVVGSLKCTLNNSERRFDDIDFTGARIIPSVGFELSDGTVEWLRKGTYLVSGPEAYSATIGLDCVDSMSLLDVPYDDVPTRYPATARTVALDICERCGVPLLYANFANCETVFKARPSGSPSCRQVMSWVAQATCNYARVTNEDRLELSWYDPSVFDDEDWIDGGEFDGGEPYETGDDVDGGDFTDWSSGASVDGGSFRRGKIVNVWAYSAESVMTDDVVVTGVRVTASDEVLADGSRGRDGETALAGSEGYVLCVEGNPLVSYGEAAETARRLADGCVGLTFRPFDVSCLSNPLVEPGDAAIVTDMYQNTHKSFVTCAEYAMGVFSSLKCSAESPLRNQSAGGGAVTRAIKGLGEDIRAEQTAREAAIQRLNDDLENAPGIYTTRKVEGGATTLYVHDKKQLSDSAFVWKMNSAGFGMSTDGGKTYAYGLDKWGNAILNTIYAIGIDAGYINTGALRVRSGSKTIFCADVRAGQFWWNAPYSKLSSTGALTVTSGNIAGFVVSPSGLYKGRGSLYGTQDGVYVGISGISVGGSSRRYVAMTGGMLEGGYNNTRCGWLAFTRGGWDGSPGVGVTLNSQGALYLGCTSLYVCDPLGSSGGTLITRGTGQDADFPVVTGVTVQCSYDEKFWRYYDPNNPSVNYSIKRRMIYSVVCSTSTRTLRFRKGILVKY